MQQHPHQQLGCITHRPLAAAILGNAGCEGRGEVRIQLAEAAVGQARAEQIGEEVGLLLREDLRGGLVFLFQDSFVGAVPHFLIAAHRLVPAAVCRRQEGCGELKQGKPLLELAHGQGQVFPVWVQLKIHRPGQFGHFFQAQFI